MRVRVCGHETTFWVELKTGWLAPWRKAPSVQFWLEEPSIRWHQQFVKFYGSYEAAREVASEYLRRFGKNVAVVQEIQR